MQKKNTLSKIITVVGTVLVWLPILAPFIRSLIVLVMDGQFLFDYLMPAELNPVVFSGCALLLWAVMRTHLQQKIIYWGAGVTAASITALMLLGDVQLGTTEYVIAISLLVLFWLGAILVGIGGILLWKDLFKK